ncbi:MAG: hypothetical protein ABEK16_03680 [Candidatus Nanohalobium sp.]
MSSETAILITIGLAVAVIALVFGFSQNVLGEARDAVIGKEGDNGIIDCNPAKGDCKKTSGSIEGTVQGLKSDEGRYA